MDPVYEAIGDAGWFDLISGEAQEGAELVCSGILETGETTFFKKLKDLVP